MSKDSIELSPKYGLNTAITKCFWCRKEPVGIALLGRIKTKEDKDVKAPPSVITSYEPCEACKEAFSKGIHVIGVTKDQPEDGRPPLQKNPDLYPTGAFFVCSENFVKNNFNGEILEEILEKRKLLMDNDMVLEIINNSEESESME